LRIASVFQQVPRARRSTAASRASIAIRLSKPTHRQVPAFVNEAKTDIAEVGRQYNNNGDYESEKKLRLVDIL
jgi:hypothetical protein